MTLAVLSWGAHKTLRNTLESYRTFNLDKLDAERIIFFQEITDQDIAIAKEFGYKFMGTDKNIGIAQAYKMLVEKSTSDLFLFLENDWTLIEDPSEQMYDAAELLRNEVVDVVRFRHRKYPGDPLYTRQFENREFDQPSHLLDSVHWTDPIKFYPFINKQDAWYMTTSQYANWTNNPTMFRTKWLKKNILPRIGNSDIEVDLQDWWETQVFMVAQGEGLFTHNRIG